MSRAASYPCPTCGVGTVHLTTGVDWDYPLPTFDGCANGGARCLKAYDAGEHDDAIAAAMRKEQLTTDLQHRARKAARVKQ